MAHARAPREDDASEIYKGLARWAGDKSAFIEEIFEEVKARGPIAGVANRRPQGLRRLVGLERRQGGLRMAVLGRPHHHPFPPRLRAALRSARARPARRIVNAPVPSPSDAHRELLRISARALGVGTAQCLRDYFRLSPADIDGRLEELVEEGDLDPGHASRAGTARPICTRTPACPARSRRAPCSRRSIRWSSSAPAPKSCSISTTASRSTRRPAQSPVRLLRAAVPARRPHRRARRPQGRPPGRRLRVHAAYAEPGAPPETAVAFVGRAEAHAVLAGLGAHGGHAGRRSRAGAMRT